MPDTKISAATDIASLVSTDMLPIARSGSTTAYHATMAEIGTYIAVPAASSTTPAMDSVAAVGVGTTWARADHVHPSDISRAPLASPALTGSPTAPTVTPATDNSTKLATTAFVQAAVAPALNDVGRNLLHNASFNVAQRGTGPWTTNAAWTVDRWTMALNVDAASFSVVALADADRTAIADEAAQYALQNTFTGSSSAGAYNIVTHSVENVRRLAGKTITVSLWAKAASGTPKLGLDIGQFFGSGGSPSTPVYTIGQAVTLSTTWARYSVTFSVPSIVGKTVGTNNDHMTRLDIWYSDQGTYAVRSGSVGVQSGTIQLWGMQLEIGSVATPLEKVDPADDLRRCQRFYQIGGAYINTYNAAGATIGHGVMFPVPMRAAPTIALNSQGYANASAATALAPTSYNFTFSATVTAAGSATASAGWTASADL